jgi:ABC-type uncharacterized transport system permease subunit
MSEQDIFAVILFGLMTNFIFSMLFAMLLHKNINPQEMIAIMDTKELKKTAWYKRVVIIIPFAKTVMVLYRVYILQVYFLNQGKSYKDYMKYLVSNQ